ncbi:unnamed protein product [Prorocentrum cordatum]|uniref:Subtilisin n=1 Tax=Prorocentrum cordatum TaxID=2364126 RepID=A0ABN9T3G3_9DINO|nr:unnamed protein product [Polarella glacialis]
MQTRGNACDHGFREQVPASLSYFAAGVKTSGVPTQIMNRAFDDIGSGPAHGSFAGGGSQWRAQSTPSGRTAPAPAWNWASDEGHGQEYSREPPPMGPGMPQDKAGLMGFLKLVDFDSCMAHGNAGAQRVRHHANSALGRC